MVLDWNLTENEVWITVVALRKREVGAVLTRLILQWLYHFPAWNEWPSAPLVHKQYKHLLPAPPHFLPFSFKSFSFIYHYPRIFNLCLPNYCLAAHLINIWQLCWQVAQTSYLGTDYVPSCSWHGYQHVLKAITNYRHLEISSSMEKFYPDWLKALDLNFFSLCSGS